VTDKLEHDSKGGNQGGSRVHTASKHGVRKPDASSDELPNDEGADPLPDIRKQNPGQKTSADLAAELAPDDPHKVEKLAKAGRHDFDPDAGSD